MGDADGWLGYVAASIDYRLGPSTSVTPPLDEQEQAQVDRARNDLQTAVRWFKANATVLGINPDRIGVGGYSAGAIMSAGAAIRSTDPEATGSNPEFSSACAARCRSLARSILRSSTHQDQQAPSSSTCSRHARDRRNERLGAELARTKLALEITGWSATAGVSLQHVARRIVTDALVGPHQVSARDV